MWLDVIGPHGIVGVFLPFGSDYLYHILVFFSIGYLVATYLFTQGWLFSTSLAVLTSRGRLLNVPPMGGFRYFAFKTVRDSSGIVVAQCYPGGAESSWGVLYGVQ